MAGADTIRSGGECSIASLTAHSTASSDSSESPTLATIGRITMTQLPSGACVLLRALSFLLGRNDDDGAVRVVRDLAADRPHHEPPEAAAAAGSDNEQVGVGGRAD